MNDLFLQDFLVSYSLPTLIVATIVCTFSLTLNKFFEKMPKLLRVYLPFVLAIILYFAFDMIFVLKTFKFRQETFYAGLLSASLSTIICSSVRKLLQGKALNVSKTALLIEGILQGYINQSCLTQTAYVIEQILLTCQDSVEQEKQVENALKENGDIIESDLKYLAKLIIQAVSSIKRT